MTGTELERAEVMDAEVVEHAPQNLFGVADPAEVIVRATATANALMRVVRDKKLATTISSREYLRVEAWTCLGSLVGVFPRTVWTKPLENGWEARVECVTRDGAVVGAAEASCLTSEKNWKNRDDYALRSMAQTRAMGKALRMPLGFIAVLAGFEATPAEEMPSVDGGTAANVPMEQAAGGGSSTYSPAFQQAAGLVLNFGKHEGKDLMRIADEDIGYVKWLAENAKDAPIKQAAQIVAKEWVPF